MKFFSFLILISVLSFSSCTSNEQLTVEQKAQVINESTLIVQKIFNASNEMRFLEGLNFYSDEDDALFVTEGKAKNLKELKEEYKVAGALVEDLENTILQWHTKVLSDKTVLFTLEVQLRLKLKDYEEYTGKLTWTATLQKYNDKWLVVQSHESWMDVAEMIKAFS